MVGGGPVAVIWYSSRVNYYQGVKVHNIVTSIVLKCSTVLIFPPLFVGSAISATSTCAAQQVRCHKLGADCAPLAI